MMNPDRMRGNDSGRRATGLIRAAWLVYLGGVLLVPRGLCWVPAAALALLALAVVRDPTVRLDMAVFASQRTRAIISGNIPD